MCKILQVSSDACSVNYECIGLHLASPSCSLELSPTSRECISRSLCVVVKVVLLDVLDARIAVVAYGCNRTLFQCKSDPGVPQGIPSQVLPM